MTLIEKCRELIKSAQRDDKTPHLALVGIMLIFGNKNPKNREEMDHAIRAASGSTVEHGEPTWERLESYLSKLEKQARLMEAERN